MLPCTPRNIRRSSLGNSLLHTSLMMLPDKDKLWKSDIQDTNDRVMSSSCICHHMCMHAVPNLHSCVFTLSPSRQLILLALRSSQARWGKQSKCSILVILLQARLSSVRRGVSRVGIAVRLLQQRERCVSELAAGRKKWSGTQLGEEVEAGMKLLQWHEMQ